MGTYSAINCDAVHGSEIWDVDKESGQLAASVLLHCEVADVEGLVTDLLINNRVAPFVPFETKPVAQRTGVTYVNLDPSTPTVDQANNYTHAQVQVSYTYPPPDNTGTSGIKVSEEISPNTQVIEKDYRDYRWGGQTGDPLRPAEAPGKIEIQIGFTRKLFQVPLPLSLATLNLIGSTNAAPYTSASFGFELPAESLLYLDPKFDRTIDFSGATVANYTQNWLIKLTGWNKFWREWSSSWESIYHVASGSIHKTYPVVDMSAILF